MGLLDALETYGTMTRRQVMGPAIRLASEGFVVSPVLEKGLKSASKRFAADPSSVGYFGGIQAGEVWKQPDLARTLRRILKRGADGFYTGETAGLIADEMQQGEGQAKGLITVEDLANYETVTRQPVRGTYRGYEIAAMSPPSSGGVHVVQMLNILEGYDLRADGHNSAAYLHKLIEAMRRAYADRSKYLGDPDFVDVPVGALTDKDYAARLRDSINPLAASTSAEILPGSELFLSRSTRRISRSWIRTAMPCL
jgi:gamma-glutamyltranspeptidase/glutathione hydrolase